MFTENYFIFQLNIKNCRSGSIVVIWVKIFKTEKTIEIQLVRLNEVCGKVLRIDTGDVRPLW